MALPPDERSEAFIREVDDNLRRDEMAGMARKHGLWAVVALIAFLAAVGGYFIWHEQQKKRSEADAEAMTKALDSVQPGGKNAAAREAYDKVAADGSKGSRGPAMLGKAALALEASDSKTASATYQAMAADTSLEQPYRDVATLRRVMVDYDQMKPDEVIAALKPLTVPGNAFFGSAGELTAAAMVAKGDRAGAGQLFAKIAADASVPESLRSRAAQYAGTLGVDASATLAPKVEGKR